LVSGLAQEEKFGNGEEEFSERTNYVKKHLSYTPKTSIAK